MCRTLQSRSGVELKDKLRNKKDSDTNAISATNVRQIPKVGINSLFNLLRRNTLASKMENGIV